MLSGLSSSLSTAMRTAGTARATMDTMTRQIATGQKVASVKDDGAVWTRAAGLKSQKAQLAGREFMTSALRVASTIQEAQNLTARESFARIRDIFVSAAGHPAGSPARAALRQAFDREIETLNQATTPNGPIDSGLASWPAGWGVQTSAADPLLAGEVVFTLNGLGFGPGGHGWTTFVDPPFTGSIASMDVANGTQEAMTEGIRYADYWLNSHLPFHERETADDQTWLDRVERWSELEENRIDTAIGSLTDADLGKASTARANAETRQQLALQTVQQAISAYGNYASGLLGNVARTQRGIMA
jgi:microcystin-dependent protein